MSSSRTPVSRIDPIAIEVFSSRLASIAEDMFTSLVRSSFSTNIKERKDCSVGVFDADGRLIAQSENTLPGHLGTLMSAVQATRRSFDADVVTDGDSFISNDPYMSGGTHLPDITIVTPIFFDARLAFFVANLAHHSDVGGRFPGSISGVARSIFEEGIRIPVTRFARNWQIDEGLLNIIAVNTREPNDRKFDLAAQLAVNRRGAAGLRKLVEDKGLERVESAIADVFEYSATRMRKAIAALPKGTRKFTTWLDDDGINDQPVPLCVTVTIGVDEVEFDFNGSAGEADGALNIPLSSLRSVVYYSLKALLDPDSPANEGLFSVAKIILPERSIVNPRFPSAVGARSLTMQRAAGAIFGAFRAFLPPERRISSSSDGMPALIFSGPRRDGSGDYVYIETVGGGGGARNGLDGLSAIQVHLTNTSNLPIEALENEYDLLVEEYGLVADSGGPGRTRGGMGIARQIRAMADGVVFSARSDGHHAGPEGIEGGGAGRCAHLYADFGTDRQRFLPSKITGLTLKSGESVRLETAGGGGYGDPKSRGHDLVRYDFEEGFITVDSVENEYNCSILTPQLSN